MTARDSNAFATERLRAVHAAAAEIVRHTPVLSSRSLSEVCGGVVGLKAENLQRTGSFKLRGAVSKLARWSEQPTAGVVAGSAGNHAQSLAYAARAAGAACEVFMPEGAAVSKLSAVAAFGATVHQQGESVDEAIELARARADEAGSTFVHPFDDDDVIAGQAGVGIELLEQVPDLGSVVVPIGGGGLAAGVALAIKSERPDVTIIGVQADACAPYIESLRCGEAVTATALPTIADGIAVKRPGGRTLELIQRLVDDVVTVSEEEIADAMVLLMERSKLVVEGAGAASLAALMAGRAKPAATGTTVAILSGGNVDTGLLALLASRSETRAGRRLRLFTTVSDRPGGLASMLSIVAADGASVISLEHVREGVELAVRRTGVELVLETRGRDHARAVVDRLTDRGYEVRAEE